MGLTIHYKGELKNASDLKSLIDTVKDVAKAEKWDYFVFEEQFENNSFSEIIDKENLFGIMVSPPKCDPFCISFLSNGKMSGIINFNVMQKEGEINEDLIYAVFSKTQYSGYENHKKLILLLDYVNKKYLVDFECIDDGCFWETRDENLLKETFEKYTNLIDGFSSSLEMIPMNEDENIEDYLIRMAETTNKKLIDEEELTQLSIEEENEFKRMKLSLEHDAIFPENIKSNLPPEIEGQFLDYVMNFEEQYKNVKRITVYEKIEQPDFKLQNQLNDEEIELELEKIETIMKNHNITLDVICDYDNETRLIYTFITEELFNHEIDDLTIPGMITHFTYEEFHPNNEYDIENTCIDFIKMFLNKKDDFYEEFHSKDAKNHEALNNFRSLFKKFKIKYYKFGEIVINDDKANATFSIDFWGKINDSVDKIHYSGNGEMTFIHEYGFWYVQNVNLPIMN
jgi:hypothetical protein